MFAAVYHKLFLLSWGSFDENQNKGEEISMRLMDLQYFISKKYRESLINMIKVKDDNRCVEDKCRMSTLQHENTIGSAFKYFFCWHQAMPEMKSMET